MEIRIATMAKFHKSGSKEPFLWNCAATAARINRKAVYSVDIILMGEEEQGRERSFRRKAETETNGLWDDDGARGTAPCPERNDAKQPGHLNVRAVRSAGRAYRAFPV